MAGIPQYFSARAPSSSRDDSSSGSEEEDGPSTSTSTLDGNGGGATTSLAPQAKHLHSHARQSGFNRAWTTSFLWVLEVEGESVLCGLCRKHTRHPPKAVVGKTTWVDVPCVTMTQQSLRSITHPAVI